MAYSKVVTSLTMLIAIHSMLAKGDGIPFLAPPLGSIPPILAPPFEDSIPPILAPVIDNICDVVNCGRGTCHVTPGARLNYVCECDAGWKRTRFLNDEDENFHQFLPCIVPNCTLDYSCMPAAPPAPAVPFNLSFFDPCYWIYCGQGTCTKNQTFTHTCECDPGYYNLQSVSIFPCFSQCALGSDCSRLGVRISRSTASPSSSPDGGNSKATQSLPGKFHWAISILVVSLAMALRN